MYIAIKLIRTIQVHGECESCGRHWSATTPTDRTPCVYCVCGRRHVVEFKFHSIPFVLDDCPHHALPSVN